MTLRTSLEAVLRKRAVAINTLAWPLGKSMTETDAWKELIDDLLACFPQPSRDVLEKIFICHAHRYPSAVAWENAIKDDLMAWATGQQKRWWCNHLKLGSKSYWIGDLASEDGIMRVPDEWTTCPLCAAPRPGEG